MSSGERKRFHDFVKSIDEVNLHRTHNVTTRVSTSVYSRLLPKLKPTHRLFTTRATTCRIPPSRYAPRATRLASRPRIRWAPDPAGTG